MYISSVVDIYFLLLKLMQFSMCNKGIDEAHVLNLLMIFCGALSGVNFEQQQHIVIIQEHIEGVVA